MSTSYAAAVVVASNRAAAGVYDDTTGPLIVEALRADGWEVGEPAVVPDGDAVAEAISGVTVDLQVEDDGVAITASVRTTDRTGVEMEALTAVSVAALTVVDMVKAVDRGAAITDVRVEEKTGGKSGTYRR